jgi:hypothetical protein
LYFCGRCAASYDKLVGPLPANTTIAPRLTATLDMVHLFAM